MTRGSEYPSLDHLLILWRSMRNHISRICAVSKTERVKRDPDDETVKVIETRVVKSKLFRFIISISTSLYREDKLHKNYFTTLTKVQHVGNTNLLTRSQLPFHKGPPSGERVTLQSNLVIKLQFAFYSLHFLFREVVYFKMKTGVCCCVLVCLST